MQDVLQRAGSPGPFAEGAALPIPATIGGHVKAGFEAVKLAFADNYAKGLERNSQCAVYHKGELVVDLWGSTDLPGMSTAPPSGYDGTLTMCTASCLLDVPTYRQATYCVTQEIHSRSYSALRRRWPPSAWPSLSTEATAATTTPSARLGRSLPRRGSIGLQ